MCRGGQWCRPIQATNDVAVKHLRKVISASGYAFVYNHRTTLSLRKAMRVLAGGLQLISGAPCGTMAAVENSAASRHSQPEAP